MRTSDYSSSLLAFSELAEICQNAVKASTELLIFEPLSGKWFRESKFAVLEPHAVTEPLELIIGAKPLAAFIFRDEAKWKSVYALKKQLGLFHLGGQLAGRPQTIIRRIEGCEADGGRRRNAAA